MVAVVIPTIGSDAVALDRAVMSATAVTPHVVVVRQAPDGERLRAAVPHEVQVVDDGGIGASRARNIGLAHVDADWVVFLDDDAELLPAFARVIHALRAAAGSAFVCWRVRDDEGRDVSRFPRRETPVTSFNHWSLTREHNTLWRTSVLRAAGGFDERLGPGRWAGADECADLMIRVLSTGARGRYLPVTGSTHPNAVGLDRAKARRYGRGAGAVIRTHIGRPTSWPFALRTVAGIASVALPARFHQFPRRVKLDRGVGIAEGILHGPRAD